MRWYEFVAPQHTVPVTALTVAQQGTYAPDEHHRFQSSIARDKAGDMLVGYTVSDAGIYPEIAIAGRAVSDPLGTLQPEQVVFSGTASQNSVYHSWATTQYGSGCGRRLYLLVRRDVLRNFEYFRVEHANLYCKVSELRAVAQPPLSWICGTTPDVGRRITSLDTLSCRLCGASVRLLFAYLGVVGAASVALVSYLRHTARN